jgi:hypothetical protein
MPWARPSRLRETLRDLASATSFRRDVYRRGIAPLPAPEQSALAKSLAFVGLGAPTGKEMTFATPAGEVVGKEEVYRPVVDMLAEGTVSVGEAQQKLADRSFAEIIQTFIMLVAGGYAAPLPPPVDMASSRESARKLNIAIAEMNALGGAVGWLAAPLTGSAIPADWIETLIVAALLAGDPPESKVLVPAILEKMRNAGRAVHRDNQPVADPAEALRIVDEGVRATLDNRAPVFARLGIID